MVEAASLLKVLPTSKLDMYKAFEHIYMLSMGIWQYPLTFIPTLLGSGFVVGHLELYRTHVLSYSTYVLLYSTMVLFGAPD